MFVYFSGYTYIHTNKRDMFKWYCAVVFLNKVTAVKPEYDTVLPKAGYIAPSTMVFAVSGYMFKLAK